MHLHSTEHVFLDTAIGEFDAQEDFDGNRMNSHLSKIHANKDEDLDQKIAENMSICIRCSPDKDHMCTTLLNTMGCRQVMKMHVCEHDRKPLRKKARLAPMMDLCVIGRNGTHADREVKSQNLLISSRSPDFLVKSKKMSCDNGAPVMNGICSVFVSKGSTALIAHGGSGHGACAVLHNGSNCTLLNHHEEVSNLAKGKLQSFICSSEETRNELMQTKFHNQLSADSALCEFGCFWENDGRTSVAIQDDAPKSSELKDKPSKKEQKLPKPKKTGE